MRYPVLLCLLLLGCGAAQTDLVRCRLEAVASTLPKDVRRATPYDADAMLEAVLACEQPATPSPILVTDAGF